MDEKITSTTGGSEYSFAESEAPPTSSVNSFEIDEQPVVAEDVDLSEQPTSKFKFNFDFKNTKLRSLITPVAIVSAILLVYTFFTISSDKKNDLAEKKKMMSQKGAEFVQSVKKLQVMPAKAGPTQSTNLGVDGNQLLVGQQQKELQQQINIFDKKLMDEQNRTNALEDSINRAEQNVSKVDQKIEALAGAIQQIFEEIDNIKKPPKKPQKKKLTRPPAAYHVRAIVPGRVWLESEHGKNVTLRVGDVLEGYGEVRAIVPRQGMVVMSNGSIIQYGVNDF